jgi:rhodanese-related sulfurtransferase
MNKITISFLLLLACSPLQAEVINLSNQQLVKMMENGTPVIDIRRAEEWKETGIIKGSHLITFFDEKGNYNLNSWREKVAKIAGQNEPFILICRSGNRTGQISHFLDGKLNYTKVHHVANGINNWIKKGLPTSQIN